MLAVRIGEIDLGGGGRAFVITVPPTQSGPHQAPDLKYYRRFEQQSVPMYERVLGHAQAC